MQKPKKENVKNILAGIGAVSIILLAVSVAFNPDDVSNLALTLKGAPTSPSAKATLPVSKVATKASSKSDLECQTNKYGIEYSFPSYDVSWGNLSNTSLEIDADGNLIFPLQSTNSSYNIIKYSPKDSKWFKWQKDEVSFSSYNPVGIFVGKDGKVFATGGWLSDKGYNESFKYIYVFAPDGTLIKTIDNVWATSVVADANYVYALVTFDPAENRKASIKKYDMDGNLLDRWYIPDNDQTVDKGNGLHTYTTYSGSYQEAYTDMSIDSNGIIYVPINNVTKVISDEYYDYSQGRYTKKSQNNYSYLSGILRFDSSGKRLSPDLLYQETTSKFYPEIYKLDIDSSGNMFVVSNDDNTNKYNHIRKYSRDGTLLADWTTNEAIYDIAVDKYGNLFLKLQSSVVKYSQICGIVTVVKSVTPAPDPTSFLFHNNFGSPNLPDFRLDDNADPRYPNQQVFNIFKNGNYAVSEESSGKYQTEFSCNGDPRAKGIKTTVVINSTDTPIVSTCTFFNKKSITPDTPNRTTDFSQ